MIKTLVLCGDVWHPASIVQQGLSALEKHGFQFDWLEDAHHWLAACMAAYPLVILAKSNNLSSTEQAAWMSDDTQAAFFDYVRQGNGLLAIHSGTAGYQQTLLLRNLLGGVFTHHPEQDQVSLEPLSGHALTTGVGAFMAQDEQYFMDIVDPCLDIFLTSRSAHGQQPAGWRRREGRGRVAVLTPGHTLEVWLHSSFQTLLLNCLRWCGAMDISDEKEPLCNPLPS